MAKLNRKRLLALLATALVLGTVLAFFLAVLAAYRMAPNWCKLALVLGAVIGRVHHSTAVSIEIANNGPEIPEEQREKIFYPLVTTRRDGSGWGLPIAQSIIGSLRGSIDCQSDRELTRFRILLPLRGLKAPQGAVTPAT